MTWNYDAQNNLLLPSISLAEVTQGNAGQTVAIPVTPPDAGFKQPPIQLPPPMPPFPVPPIDWGVGGGTNYAAPVYGYDSTNSLDLFYSGAGIYFDGTTTSKCYGVWRVPDTYVSETVTIAVAISMGGAATSTVNAKLQAYRERCDAAIVSDTDAYSDVVVANTGIRTLNCIYAKEVSVSLSLQAGDCIRIVFDRAGTAGSGTDSGEAGYVVAFLILMI
jgi:hypothetical protein